MQSILDSLNWRYAVKQYDNTKKITQEELETLKEAVRLTPTSAGIQPFKLIVVEDKAMKDKLLEASLFNSSQVADSSHLFVFAAKKEISAENIREYINLIAETRGIDAGMLEGFEKSMTSYLVNRSPEEAFTHSAKQAYIGLGILITAAATMRVDATPMEGFNREQYDEILGLTDYSVAVICAIGHRAESDGLQHMKKVRKPEETFFSIH